MIKTVDGMASWPIILSNEIEYTKCIRIITYTRERPDQIGQVDIWVRSSHEMSRSLVFLIRSQVSLAHEGELAPCHKKRHTRVNYINQEEVIMIVLTGVVAQSGKHRSVVY